MSNRIDTWLVQNNFFDSRQRAQMAIKEGKVWCNGKPVNKPSQWVQPGDSIEVEGDPLPYVSRGGLKLEKAIRTFQLDFTGRKILDVGASTGGFTDCALKHGAAGVFAVDVGAGQLAAALREHPRVVYYENFDVRQLSTQQLGNGQVDAIVCDVSFISLRHILPVFPLLLKEGGFVVLLIKPQFELEQRRALKGGIVKDPALRKQALEKVLSLAQSLGFQLKGLTETDAEEGKKNVEYLAWLQA